MNLSKRLYTKELLDGNDIPFADIKRNMQELNTINTLLGGHKITIDGLRQLIGSKKEVIICEIGCGGGDNLVAVSKALRRKHIAHKCIGIDIKQECLDFAKQNIGNEFIAEWVASDYRIVSFKQKPDIIFSSLFCHHFTELELQQQLQWMRVNSNTGFFINDLHRHAFAYYAIKFLTRLFSRSYLVRNDAPLSVARGFKKEEWQEILSGSGIENYSIKWKWAFRFLILYKHERS